MPVTRVLDRRHMTIETFNRAAWFRMSATLKLDGRMTNVILLVEHIVQRLQDGRTTTGRKVVNERVA